MVTLQTGANTSITKQNPLIDDLVIGFGWDVIRSNGPEVELVPAAVMVNQHGEALNDESFVFFNQLSTPDDGVRYVEGEDDEQIEISLSKIPSQVQKIVFVVFIDPDVRKPGTFQAVRDPYIKVMDRDLNIITRYDVVTTPEATAMIFAELYRYNSEWKFRAVGQGYTTGILGVTKDFRVQL